VIEQKLPVIPVPGASAALAALAGSGLPTDEFWFIGFLPTKPAARRKTLTQHFRILHERDLATY
jgi:16S rRNA (cytidine1402-2'-O)-methyltransferase